MPDAALGYQVDGDEPKDEEDQTMEPKEENGMEEAVKKEGLMMLHDLMKWQTRVWNYVWRRRRGRS